MDDSGVEALTKSISPPSPALTESIVRSGYRDRDFILRRGLLVADMLGLWLALTIAVVICGNRDRPEDASLWFLSTLPVWVLLFRAYGLYGRPTRRFEPTHLDDASSLVHALVIGAAASWLLLQLLPIRKLDGEEIIVFVLLALPLVATLRVGLRMLNLRLRGPERIFVVGIGEDVRLLQRKLRNHSEYEMSVVGALPIDGDVAGIGRVELCSNLSEVDSLIASGEVDHLMVELDANLLSQDIVVELMRKCFRAGVRFGAFPRAKGLLPLGVEINHLEGVGFLSYHPPVLSRTSCLMKRTMDLVLTSIVLVVFLPLIALIAAAIKLSDRGPVFFRQVRVGKDETRFKLIKFRTMVPDAERQTDELMAQSRDPDWLDIERDPRVTRLGHFLRRTSLDELPELWNVIRGEMSLVGPRPLSERDDMRVEGWRRHRLDVLPGVTGYWQVSGRTSIPFREMVEVDYYYVAGWSIWLDIKLLMRTVPAVLRRRGAN